MALAIITGFDSSSWDTIAELVGLALNSKAPVGYEDMTVEIRRVSIFRQEVGIRRVGRDGFQIDFGSPEIGLSQRVSV